MEGSGARDIGRRGFSPSCMEDTAVSKGNLSIPSLVSHGCLTHNAQCNPIYPLLSPDMIFPLQSVCCALPCVPPASHCYICVHRGLPGLWSLRPHCGCTRWGSHTSLLRVSSHEYGEHGGAEVVPHQILRGSVCLSGPRGAEGRADASVFLADLGGEGPIP